MTDSKRQLGFAIAQFLKKEIARLSTEDQTESLEGKCKVCIFYVTR